jgi:hypothetical protein
MRGERFFDKFQERICRRRDFAVLASAYGVGREVLGAGGTAGFSNAHQRCRRDLSGNRRRKDNTISSNRLARDNRRRLARTARFTGASARAAAASIPLPRASAPAAAARAAAAAANFSDTMRRHSASATAPPPAILAKRIAITCWASSPRFQTSFQRFQ